MDSNNIKKLFLSFSLVFFLVSCGGSGGANPPSGINNADIPIEGLSSCIVQNATQGVICGKAVAADGITPLAGAEIKVAATSATSITIGSIVALGVGNPNKCLADILGDFACLVPSNLTGDIGFVIKFSGYESKSFNENVTTGQIATAGTLAMVGDNTTNWLVIPGAYDGVQVLLAQLKGCTLNNDFGIPYDPTQDSPESARGSDDCTAKGLVVVSDSDLASSDSVIKVFAEENLNNYDALFINCDADWSMENGVDASIQSFSDAGKHIYFSDLSSLWLTSSFPDKVNFAGNDTNTGTISANVKHTGLAAVVGNPIDVVFDLPVWSAIDTVEAGVTTFIDGDFASPLSNYPGVHPITSGWRPSATSGCIFYTSYHIEGASVGAAQEIAIKYLVQNIGKVCV